MIFGNLSGGIIEVYKLDYIVGLVVGVGSLFLIYFVKEGLWGLEGLIRGF